MEDLLNRGLPKWPQMVVLGEQLPVEQALEIIRRTDNFFSFASGNNHYYLSQVCSALGKFDPEERLAPGRDFRVDYAQERDWLKKWEFVSTEYVHNSWVSAAYIFGPYGWCSPQGLIAYGDNIGKYPSIEAVLKDWTTIAEAFPMVKLDVALFDGEQSSETPTKPVVGLHVRNGIVGLIDPNEGTLFTEFGSSIETCQSEVYARRQRKAFDEEVFKEHMSGRTRPSVYGRRTHENGISDDVIAKWAQHAQSLGLVEG